ncbi:hypothetical protein QYE76_070835 [Lolium multiflorum]|uniref:RNase H type-1 domain-containing protein n=1 Tax=Lolium multiflorum TaxID=4521 RepID=A0AAD8WET8_LOLMU|nr:hypothetical protein QYE76_070835 [Lolium multiflorum]
MLDAETRYPEIEKLCLCLFFTCTKIQHILLSAEIIVICKSDVIKHMLSAPVLKGRLGKWMFALSELDLRYQPAKAVKGQALADLIAERINTNIAALSIRAWAMFFDGSVCDDGCGIDILFVSPRGATYTFSIRLSTLCTNNVAEYEAVRKGMELLIEVGAEAVELFGDSKLVISQLTDEYKCESESLFPLWMHCRELMTQFRPLPAGGFWHQHIRTPGGTIVYIDHIAIYIEMAADGTPVTYEELPDELKKRYDEIKMEGILTARCTRWDRSLCPVGGTHQGLRQEINYLVAHSLHRHSENLVNVLERLALRVIQEIMSHRYSPSGPALGTHQGELPLQSRPPLPYALAAPEVPATPAFVVYKIGGDPSDYQFLTEAPKEIPQGYACTYVPDCGNWPLSNQATTSGTPAQTGGTSATA